MKEYARKSEIKSRTWDSNPRASKQASIGEILQAYQNRTFGKFVQRQSIDEEKSLQTKTAQQDTIKSILQQYKERNIQRYVSEEKGESVQGRLNTTPGEDKLLQGKFKSNVIQCVKKYNHGSKLYVNDEDDEPAPVGYRWVSEDSYDTDSDEWVTNRDPSTYFVGSGGLGSAESFLYKSLFEWGQQPSVTVTTYESLERESQLHPEFRDNEQSLMNMGSGQIKERVDATDRATMSPTRYDRVDFGFPHTGIYGGTPEKDAQALASNQELMEKSMAVIGNKKVKPGGILSISEGGFPYRNSTTKDGRTRQGMDLDQIAVNEGYTVMPASPLGTSTIGRSTGGTVTLPHSIRHNYQAPPVEMDPISLLMSTNTHWTIKRRIVRNTPSLIDLIRKDDTELADLLQQYAAMEDSEMEPGVDIFY